MPIGPASVTAHRRHAGASAPFLRSCGSHGTKSNAGTFESCAAYGAYVDEPLALINSGGTYFYADNRVYSPAAMTDSSGTVQERYTYDSYGNRTVMLADDSAPKTSGFVGNQRGFTGYYADAESGLYYARAIMYSPVLGRFIGRDPKDYENGLDLYADHFVPTGVDPRGTHCCCVDNPDDCYIEYAPGDNADIFAARIANGNWAQDFHYMHYSLKGRRRSLKTRSGFRQ
jgi:RHS repeat-associated protein